MRLTRRQFLEQASRTSAGVIVSLSLADILMACHRAEEGNASIADSYVAPYGALVKAGPDLMLPPGFRYVKLRTTGDMMSDGLETPGAPDGSGAFAGSGSRIRLVVNHELSGPGDPTSVSDAYDRLAPGGVTLAEFDPVREALVESRFVLSGTDSNCNGGATPWNSWLSCEETTGGRDAGFEQEHGFVFEVPSTASAPVAPNPLRAMGRFVHEAAVVDPATGFVYMTEDNGDPGDGFYRFVPRVKGNLAAGGKLQMLAVTGSKNYDTTAGQAIGQKLDAEWVDIDDPDPDDAEKDPAAVYKQGHEKGAARFLGLEGAFFSGGAAYFIASESGDEEQGQVWRYTPGSADSGELSLVYESRDESILNQPDTIVITPRGGILLCEDGDGEERDGGDNFIRGITPNGRVFDFAKVIRQLDLHEEDDEVPPGSLGASESTGATFSPDGKWLFLHVQFPGITFAITGPWENGNL